MSLEKPSNGETSHRTVGPVTTAAALGGGVATLIAWLTQIIFNIEMPTTVEIALGTIITVAGVVIGGYLVPGKTGDHVARRN